MRGLMGILTAMLTTCFDDVKEMSWKIYCGHVPVLLCIRSPGDFHDGS